jgi:formate dehydrogenase subunit gamma
MKVKVIAISALVLVALAVGIVFSNTANAVFFDSIPWLIFLAAGLGLIFGAARAILKGKEEISYGEVTRHGGGAFFEHWGTAFGIFIALASAILMGFLFFPHIINTPDTIDFPLNMHFVGVVVTVFGGFFFIGDYLLSRDMGKLIPNIPDIIGGTIAKYLLRRKWTAEDKYLSSQKSAFLGFAVIGAVILITGAIKVAAHIWPITAGWWSVANVLHDLFSFLFMILLFVHIALVLALPAHWPSLTSWVTGKVSEEYAEEEHPVWDEELKTGKRRGYRLL